MYCGSHLQTRKSLKRHCEALHHGKRLSDQHHPQKVFLTFFTNQHLQTLSCPLPFCSFVKFHCENTKHIAKHFTSSHPFYELVIEYHCQRCNEYIDPMERFEHNRAHIEHDSTGTPLNSAIPHINEHDDSLEFIKPPIINFCRTRSPNATSSTKELRLAPTPPYKLPTHSKPSSSQSVPETQIPITDSTSSSPELFSSHPSSGSCVMNSEPESTLSSAVLDSTAILPSPATPLFFDPTTQQSPSLELCDAVSITAGSPLPDLSMQPESMSCLSPVVLDSTDILPSPTTPSFLEPTTQQSSPSVLCDAVSISTGSPIPTISPELASPNPLPSRASIPFTSPRVLSPSLSPALDVVSTQSANVVPQTNNSSSSHPSSQNSQSSYLQDREQMLARLKRLVYDNSDPSQEFVSSGAHQDECVLSRSDCDVESTSLKVLVDCDDVPSTPAPNHVSSKVDPSGPGINDTSPERITLLDIIKRTLSPSLNESPSSQDIVNIRGVTSTAGSDDRRIVTVVNDSPDRLVAPIASGIPLSNQLRPSSRLFQNRRRVVDISQTLKELRPPAKQKDVREVLCNDDPPNTDLGDSTGSNSGMPESSVDANDLEPLDCEQLDSPDLEIPSAQPRPHRPPLTVRDENQNPRDSPPPDGLNDALNDSLDAPILDEDVKRLQLFRDKWCEVFSGDLPWQEFSSQCEVFAADARSLASELNKPPSSRNNNGTVPLPPKRPAHGRPVSRFDPVEARRIQGLYKHSKKRAARKLLNNNMVVYSGTLQDVETYFTDVFSEKHCNTNLLCEALKDCVPSGEDDETTTDLYTDMSETEVAAKLRAAVNTSPGADRCEYAHLKKVDPSAKILTLIFNRCLLERNVPSSWKEALTILIYKKGDASDVSNFRPIALMSCIYKVFMGVIAKRITSWSISAGILSEEQKSARPTEGCYEHTFIMKSLVADARRRKKKLNLAWLDIRNAFGSVPYSTISTTLRHMGVPPNLISLVMNAYSGASTVVKTSAGTTQPIPIQAGVKQGCPLSPILFNLCIELILRNIKSKAATLKSGVCTHHGSSVSCLAYADDLVVVARSKKALQSLLDAASESATILGFSFRPDKCASLSLTSTRTTATTTEVNDYTIQGNHIPALQREESYRYLGVPIGLIHNIDDLPNIVPRLLQDIETIRKSLLAPWQKLDMIRVFVQPCLTYALRAGNPLKASLDEYRKTLISALRDICNLPSRSTTSYFFAHKKVGGLAYQDPKTECDLQAIVQAIRVLSSSDPTVVSIAREELKHVVRRSAQTEPTAELITKYLSASDDPRLKHLYYTYSSLWTRVRMACRRLRVSFIYANGDPPTIRADDSDNIKSKQVTSFLHRLVQLRNADDLMSLSDQGKVARCLADDQYSNGSTWHMTGLNIRFRDWRFIHRARLNCLPLNANKHRWSQASPTCRHCHQPETLPHVICHCRPEMVQIRQRHDKIVERLVNAVRFGNITTDKTVRDSGSRLRPDIVIQEENNVYIVDVTCPFDNDVDALGDAAAAKVLKYQPLKEFFLAKNMKCEVFPFVIGALGSWYKQNEILLTKLGMTRRYKSLFRKLCCTDAIQGSTNIYRLHLGWDDAAPAE